MGRIILFLLANGYRAAIKKFGKNAVDKVRSNPNYTQKLDKIKTDLMKKYKTGSMSKINRIKKEHKKANQVYAGIGVGSLGYLGYEYANALRNYPQTGKNLNKK